MGYPDQKDDQHEVPVEDSERLAGEYDVVAGRVIEPDEDRLVGADTDEPAPSPGEGPAEDGKHRYTGDAAPGEPAAEDDQVVLESSEAGPVTPAPAGETVAGTAGAAADAGPDRVGEATPMPGGPAVDEPDGPADITNPDPAPEPAAVNHDWREIMAMFVDDPRAATERAARVVDGSVEDLVRSLKGEQESLRSAWQGGSADTERMRTALKDYRSLWQRLDGIAHRA